MLRRSSSLFFSILAQDSSSVTTSFGIVYPDVSANNPLEISMAVIGSDSKLMNEFLFPFDFE